MNDEEINKLKADIEILKARIDDQKETIRDLKQEHKELRNKHHELNKEHSTHRTRSQFAFAITPLLGLIGFLINFFRKKNNGKTTKEH